VRRCLPGWVLTGCILAGCSSGLSAATAGQASEVLTARYMESVRNSPGLLLAFLREMPKGGDLHNHLWGAIYAESFIEWAVENKQCVDPKTLVLYPAPCNGMTNTVPAANALSDSILYRDMVDAYSMRNWRVSGQSGHDHFFDSFDKFAATATVSTGKMLAETSSRAASQKEIYQELMVTFTGDGFRDMVQKTPWTDDLVQMQKLLAENGMDAVVAEARQVADAAEAEESTLLRCESSNPDPGCDITQRYLFQVLRGAPKNVVFAQLMLGFELASHDERFVGINLVQPEDYYVPMHDFPAHMHMLQYLHGQYPNIHIALHAGELAVGMVPPEGLGFHIRDSVELGAAERIGHGVDIMFETRPRQLMKEMAERGVMVEICLTSNDSILGVKGKDHSLRQYMRAGVPVALATDDEGVSRSTMTLEYMKGVQEQGLTYTELKNMARTSLEHAFLPGSSLWSNPRTFVAVKDCASDKPTNSPRSESCQNFLESSPKAGLQWQLERQFRDFESRSWTSSGTGIERKVSAP
jgi:adenosine deaminase